MVRSTRQRRDVDDARRRRERAYRFPGERRRPPSQHRRPGTFLPTRRRPPYARLHPRSSRDPGPVATGRSSHGRRPCSSSQCRPMALQHTCRPGCRPSLPRSRSRCGTMFKLSAVGQRSSVRVSRIRTSSTLATGGKGTASKRHHVCRASNHWRVQVVSLIEDSRPQHRSPGGDRAGGVLRTDSYRR